MSRPFGARIIFEKGTGVSTGVLRRSKRTVLFSSRLRANPSQENGTGAPQEFSDEFNLDPPGMNEENQNRISRYQASRLCKKTIQEGDRPLSEYMTLPVSQYSVLDAEKVERISDEMFRVQIGAVSFLGTTLIPIMTLTVKPHDTGCEITLLECLLDGSKLAKDANSRFSCQMRNYVSYQKDPETNELQITGDCSMKIAGIVPKVLSVVFPIPMVNNLGEKMLSQILRIAMPRFLDQLEKDYLSWAAGDDSREAMGTGEFTVTDTTSSDAV
eukprot:g7651.t1